MSPSRSLPPEARPVAWWRRRDPGGRVLVALLSGATRCGLRLRVRGDRHVPRSGPALVAVNHIGHLDPLLLIVALRRVRRRPRFLAVSGLYDVPIVGWLLRVGRAIPVRRGAGPEPMVEAARAALAAGQLVVVYPEGTIPPHGEERRPQRGAGLLALGAGAPVIPAAVWGVQHGARWWPPRRRAAVVFGPPVTISAAPERPGDDPGQASADELWGAVRALVPAAQQLCDAERGTK